MPAPFTLSNAGPTSAHDVGMEEHVACSVVAAHRARLDWMLRVPEWADLFAAGVEALQLPGRRQGIALEPALLALPLESKHQLIRWALERYRHHLRSSIAQRLCRLVGLERFNEVEVESHLTSRQWTRLREQLLFRLAAEHRRYKHAQQLLFTTHQHLIDEVVAQIVFCAGHRADCAQEGALGLLAAIDRVSGETSRSLAAYAVTWIRRCVRNYLMRQRLPVEAPVNLVSRALAIAREDDRATQAADAGGAEEERSHHNESEWRRRVWLLECLRHPAVALDAPIDEHGSTVAETVADHAQPSPAEAAAQADLCAAVALMVGTLTEKQREVLVQRFGLAGRPVRTLTDIARQAGISHQQAGMRERRALERLETALSPVAAEWYAD